jgi:DNA segregation ATPase FtsK/SpoIIIE, S-DNA-T family
VLEGKIPPPRRATVEAVDHNGDLIEVPVAKQGNDGTFMPERIPYIVIVIDEFADLIMQQGKEVETSVARLAQKARAAGMHVILATQRPSVDVITGMIKANFPSRIAYRVAQKVDSRTILDEMGAEVLLGKGDMLVKMNGATDTLRVQCPFVSEEEINELCDHLRRQGEPKYDEAILQADESEAATCEDEPVDARFEEAILIVRDSQRCSTSWLQRKMTIGYNRAAKMVDMMERRGYVGPPNGSKDREVLLFS